MDNYTIADRFSLLSKLMDINGENSFKTKTYSIAAYHIEKLDVALEQLSQQEIATIKGLGPSVASKTIELLQTGNMTELDHLISVIPASVIEMMKLKNLGPKKIHTIWKEMDIQSIGELEYACHENRLKRYKGFGDKTQQNILASIAFYNQSKGMYLYAQLYELYPTVLQYLEQLFGKGKVLPTGSFTRQLTIVENLAFVVDATVAQIKAKMQTAYPPEILLESDEQLTLKLTNGLPLQLFANTTNIYSQQFRNACSHEFLHAFEHLTDLSTGFSSELDIFEKAAVPYIPPYLREAPAIIEKAKQHSLPQVLQASDIKGLIHNHSKWSDGVHTIEEMAAWLQKKGYEYLVMSDHSRTAVYADGLSIEKVLEQHQEIDRLNKKLAPFKIFKSIESDILNDGSLDYPDEILQQFDLVIASIHSNIYMNETKAMERLTRAIENPYTTILGHLTGRLLLSRNGYPIDHEKIIDACAANDVVIEINANPHRLDLDWKWIDYALNKNVLLSINPDAHSIEGFKDIQFGVLAAQKGGLTAAHNLSSFSLPEFENFLLKVKK